MHGEFLGMTFPEDAAFLWLAEESLDAPLPGDFIAFLCQLYPYPSSDDAEGWEVYHTAEGTPYHGNELTGASMWEHPLDETYRNRCLVCAVQCVLS